MNARRLITVLLTVPLIFAPVGANASTRTPPKPAAVVSITSLTETCGAGGYTWVEATIKATAAITVDVWVRGDSDGPWATYVAETDTLAAGETLVTDLSLSWPQKVDVVLTKPGASINSPLTSKSVAAASTCYRGW